MGLTHDWETDDGLTIGEAEWMQLCADARAVADALADRVAMTCEIGDQTISVGPVGEPSGEPFVLRRELRDVESVTTNGAPYDLAVMVLLLRVEALVAGVELTSDAEEAGWAPALGLYADLFGSAG